MLRTSPGRASRAGGGGSLLRERFPSTSSPTVWVRAQSVLDQMESGRVWDNTARLRIRKPRSGRRFNDGLIVIFQIAAGLESGDIPMVKSLKARFKGADDCDFSVCKNLSNPIPLRVSPMALLENSIAGGGNGGDAGGSLAGNESKKYCEDRTPLSSSPFYFFDVNLNPVDGPVEEIILAFEKRNVSKVEEVIVLLPDKRFIGFASSLPLDPAEQREQNDTPSGSTTYTARPATDPAPKPPPVVTPRKFSASEIETLMDKVKRFQDRKRTVSPQLDGQIRPEQGW